MNMTWKYEKPCGTVEIVLDVTSNDVDLMCRVNDGQWNHGGYLDKGKKAFVYSTPVKIGKDVMGGYFLPNYPEVEQAYLKAKEAINHAAAVAREEEIAAIKSGKKMIRLPWQDGEYYSGHTVFGVGAGLLEELGLAHYLEGWGTAVDIKGLTTGQDAEISYDEAVASAQPRMEDEARIKAEKEAKEAAIFAHAKATGKPQKLRSWMDDCNDPREECSTDVVTLYAMPDGSTKTERQHTW